MYSARFAILLLAALSGISACDKRTPEEKGKDAAEEKIGYAEGAAKVLQERGGDLGKTAGQGVGDLIKGIGTGVKDVISPPVDVALDAGAGQAGVVVNRANEADAGADARVIEAYTAFTQAFRGKLAIRAFDEQGKELGLGVLDQELDQLPGSNALLRFSFPSTVRFSHVKTYRMETQAPVAIAMHESAAAIEASQFSRQGAAVSLYMRFPVKFSGALQLRVYDASGAEIGRSEPSAELNQAADSASFLDFPFDARVRLDQAVKYEVRKSSGKA